MPNRRAFDHIGNFNFKIEIEGVTTGAFRNVEGLDSETEVIEYQDGDDLILRKRPGRTKYSNITLKRGYINNTELWEWRKAVIEGKVQRKSGSIILCADDGGEIIEFTVVGTAVRAPWLTHPPGQPVVTDLSGQDLWALAQDFGAHGEEGPRRATLEYLVKHYPSSRFAQAAADELAAARARP